MAFSVSAAENSGHVPMSLPSEGSRNRPGLGLDRAYGMSPLTMNLKFLSRRGVNELAVDKRFFNEKRLVFELVAAY